MEKVKLENNILEFLKTLEPDSFFWISSSDKFDIQGIVQGEPVFILVMVKYHRLKIKQINFSAKITRAGGKFYTVRSLDDICELAKVGGWHD